MTEKTMGYRQQIEQAGLNKSLISYELGITRGALDRWLSKDDAGRLETYKSFCLHMIITNLIAQQTDGKAIGHRSVLWG